MGACCCRFDVRCCQLSPAFIQALPSSTQASTPTSVAHRISMMTTDPMHGDEHAAQHASKVAKVLQQFSTYTGITPLYTKQPTSTAGQASLSSFDNQSADGFGAPVGMNNTACLSWQDLITSVRAMPNDFLTVIVMQHASYGTLWKSIQDGIFTTQDDMTYADRRRRLRALLRTAREIAMGIEHLHACHVVHGDLKPANVLLQDSRVDSRGFTALLADFGLARLVTGAKHMSVKPSGTASYMAPELLASGEVSNRTDIYAYGIMLFEMVHGHAAYKQDKQKRVLAAVVHGFRPVWEVADEGQMPGLHMIYNRCVDGDPGARPTARELVAQLGQLEEEVRNEAQQERKLLKRQGKQEGR
ncbi:kinase-like domain-containing protein [Haematococcus lacustris]